MNKVQEILRRFQNNKLTPENKNLDSIILTVFY